MLIFVSLLWGMIAAVAAAMIAFGLSIAVVWAFIFGDHLWPSWAWILIIAASISPAVLAGFHIGARVWFRLQQARTVSAATASRQEWALLLGGIGAAALLIAWIAHES